VLIVILAELIWLTTRAGWGFTDALIRLLPGALMMVALRGALTGMEWPWIAVPLLLSFPAHLADLARRSTGPASPPGRQ
jgi:hypothetical protein